MTEINHEGKLVILSNYMYNNLFLGDTKTLKRNIYYDRTKHKEIRKKCFFLFKASILLFKPADVRKNGTNKRPVTARASLFICKISSAASLFAHTEHGH